MGHDSEIQKFSNLLNREYSTIQHSWNDSNAQKFSEKMDEIREQTDGYAEKLSELLDSLDKAEKEINELSKGVDGETSMPPYGSVQREREW